MAQKEEKTKVNTETKAATERRLALIDKEVKRLIRIGKKRGHITYDEVGERLVRVCEASGAIVCKSSITLARVSEASMRGNT